MQLTKDVQHEADEPMVCCKWQEQLVHKNHMLEVVYDTFSIEEIHGSSQEVPIQGLGEA
jgi:hypothetical protein